MIKNLTFHKLITDFIIEIPIIQRDYAQGRELPNVTYIRNKFVADLVSTVVRGASMPLGFLYGKIEGKDKVRNMLLHKEAVEKSLHTVEQYANQFEIRVNSAVETEEILASKHSLRFIPLDGQQRLTTLYLLYWYINMRKNTEQVNWLSNFKYNNRKSALAFFEELGKAANIKCINSELAGNLKKQLQDYTWYLGKWDYDATVSGALVMLDCIHSEFAKYPETCFGSIQLETLQFSFDFLDLDALKQSDELYIKMNERGKQLTDFEHFKAWLQDYANKKYTAAVEKAFLIRFWKKLDTIWLNFFWTNTDADFTGLDDIFFNFLKTTAINYHLATDCSKALPPYLKDLLQEIRNSEVYERNNVTYIPLSRFLHVVEVENNTEVLFELFSLDCLRFIDRSFSIIMHLRNSPEEAEVIEKIIRPPFTSQSILSSYISKNAFTLTLWDQVMFFAILKYYEHNTEIDRPHLENWLRILRNLIYNTYIQSPENLFAALQSLNELFAKRHLDLLSDSLINDNLELKFFNQSQLKEEEHKAILVSDESWRTYIERFENNTYFHGQIGFILKMASDASGKHNLDNFKRYGSVLEKLYRSDTDEYFLQRALLSIKDYAVKVGSNFTFCKTDTDSLRSRNENWRRVFNDDERFNILKQLVLRVLDFESSQEDLSLILKNIIKTHTYTTEHWEYYFMKYAYPLKVCGLLEIRRNSNDDVRLLPKKTVIGYHLELRTVYLKTYLSKKLTNLPAFIKIELLWDSTAGGHPGISFVGYVYKEKKYRLDIRYLSSQKKYEFSFFHEAKLKEREMDNVFRQTLCQYVYDKDSRQLDRLISFQDILGETELLLSKLKSLTND